MPAHLIPRVILSLEPLLSGPQSQPAIRFNLEGEGEKFAMVQIPGLGRIPVLVAIRLVLMKAEDNTQHWIVWVAPYEAKLLTRFLGRPSGRLEDVGYQVTARLKEALRAVAVNEPPIGTIVQATLMFTPDGKVKWDWYISTIEIALRRHEKAMRHNELVFAGSFGFAWLRRLLKWGLVEIPEKPKDDLWVHKHKPKIETQIEGPLFMVLTSLWRAAFAEGSAAVELKASGYAMDLIGRTRLGGKDLRKIFAKARDHQLTSITIHG